MFEICAADLRCRPACDPDLGGSECRNGETCMEVTFEENGIMIPGPLCVFTGTPMMMP